jgi:hypothetical protein
MEHALVLISYASGRTWLLRKMRRLVEAALSPVINILLDELYC